MGNHRFRLSNMMPNSWFYKLRDMGRPTRRQSILHSSMRSHHNPSPNPFPPAKEAYLPNRSSYYFPSREQTEKPSHSPAHPKASDTHFLIDQPRTSKKKSRRRPIKPSPKLLSSVPKSDHIEFDGSDSFTSSATDIIIDMKSHNSAVSEHNLPPILTKPAKKEAVKAELDGKNVILKRSQSGIHRIKVRPSSPRVASKRVQANRSRKMVGCKGLSESFVVVKSSTDPQRDFRESMVEMIIENDIQASRDLEELLACYLSLNSMEYHDVIVKVFEEIWYDISEVLL